MIHSELKINRRVPTIIIFNTTGNYIKHYDRWEIKKRRLEKLQTLKAKTKVIILLTYINIKAFKYLVIDINIKMLS